MSLPRIFVSSPLGINQKIVLDELAAKHLIQVLRLKINDAVILFNNSNGEFSANISNINKRSVEVVVKTFIECYRESPLKIHLGQGVSRGEKMDFTIQKAVELGVDSITPIFTEHCNVKLSDERLDKRLQHWQNVAISAAEQSGRCFVPKILFPKKLESWCAAQESQLKIVCDPKASLGLRDLKESCETVSILVGPEGGLSDQEITLAKEYGFLSVVFGPRILRTETAALAIISALQAKWGDF